MEYQITSFDEKTGSITVAYRHNGEIVGIWGIDVPIGEDGNYITGEELEQRIMSQYPSWVIERMERLKAGIPNANVIASLVVPLPAEPVKQMENVGTQDL
jgi:hypothetical protein